MTADDEPSVMDSYVNCTFTFHENKSFGSLFFEGRSAFFSFVSERFRVCGNFEYLVTDTKIILFDVRECGDVVLTIGGGGNNLDVGVNRQCVATYRNVTPHKMYVQPEQHNEWWDTKLAQKVDGLQLDD